jgi:glycosyltransferase involved in cell wall biosynthesis
MKILYVVHQFFPNHYTGTERVTLQIAKQIQFMGNFVSVLTYEPNNTIDGFVSFDNHVSKSEYQFETIPVIAFKTDEKKRDYNIYQKSLEKYLKPIIKEFDLVHIIHPMRLGSVMKVCSDLNIPTILTLTDNWLLCPQGLLTKNMQLCDGPDAGKKCQSACSYGDEILSRYSDAKSFLNAADMVFVGCEFLKENIQMNNWRHDIQVNMYSVDFSYVKPEVQENDEIVFAFIGSLIWQKGAHILINSFKKIKSDKIKLKIFGSGVEGDVYPERVLSMIKDDTRIEYCGIFEYHDLPEIMNKISVVVIPSLYKEIYPLVMQLSFAYKKPVIASKIGGLPESILDGINGYLFEIGNVQQLTSILSMISDNPEILTKLKKNIHNPPRIEEEAFIYENAYRQLLSKK